MTLPSSIECLGTIRNDSAHFGSNIILVKAYTWKVVGNPVVIVE